MAPLVVVEGSPELIDGLVDGLRAQGWSIARGWQPRHLGARTLCVGEVASAEDAAAALLAAVGGAGLLIDARAERDIIDRLCEDLRRFGPVDHRIERVIDQPQLSGEEANLLTLMLEGSTLGHAASQLGLSRRTADRRLADARRRLGVATTAEAMSAFARVRRSP